MRPTGKLGFELGGGRAKPFNKNVPLPSSPLCTFVSFVVTRFYLPEPNGFSSDGLCGVNNSAPFSVMCMSSSRRIPNSPRI